MIGQVCKWRDTTNFLLLIFLRLRSQNKGNTWVQHPLKVTLAVLLPFISDSNKKKVEEKEEDVEWNADSVSCLIRYTSKETYSICPFNRDIGTCQLLFVMYPWRSGDVYPSKFMIFGFLVVLEFRHFFGTCPHVPECRTLHVLCIFCFLQQSDMKIGVFL